MKLRLLLLITCALLLTPLARADSLTAPVPIITASMSLARAQTVVSGGGSAVQAGVGAPAGSCAANALYVNTSNGNLYTCNSGTWAIVTSGGSGTVTVVSSGSLGSTQVVTGGGNTTLQTPNSSTILDSSGNLTLGGGLTTGSPGGGVGGYLFLSAEGTAPAGLSTATKDNCYADSTQHGLLCNFNAGTTLPLVQGPASSTSTHLAAFNSTTGGLLADSGIVDTAAGLLAACTGCAPLASPTFSGTVTLPTGITDASSTFNVPTGVTLNIASGATLNCAAGSTCPSSGSTGSLTGSSLTAYNVYYFGGSGLAKAKSDSSSTLPGICVASSTTVCVYSGVVTNGSWSWTEGGLVYVSDATGGLMTQTAPSTSGHYIQIAGVATSSTTILVLPSVNVAGL